MFSGLCTRGALRFLDDLLTGAEESGLSAAFEAYVFGASPAPLAPTLAETRSPPERAEGRFHL